MKPSTIVPRIALALSLLFCAGCRATATEPASSVEPVAAKAAFERLRRIVGRWETTTTEGKTVGLSYRLVASDSALVETFTTPSGKETLTIFHLDGPRLLATHYCGQGNQPRLRLQQASDRSLEFTFHDATNLASPASSHLAKLKLELNDADHFQRTETYVADGKDETTVYPCRRLP